MKRLISLVLISVMMFFTACSLNPEDTTSNQDAYYPITVTDQAGREVLIESEPQRIVSCYYIPSSLLIALDLDSRMVGIEDNADYRPIYSLSAPELLDLPNVGTVKVFDVEACMATEPDLVIMPLRLRDTASVLEDLGLDVILVNPENQDLLIEMIDVVARATNKVDRGQELIDFITNTDDMLNSLLEGVDSHTVYLGGNNDFLLTSGNAMYQSGVITNAGGINVAEDIDDTYWAEVSYEQVLAWNPEYIIIAANSQYTVEDVLADENLAVVDAVINGNVYQLPSNIEAWDSPVPGGILGSVWIANVLYPDLVTDEILENTIEDYYETFYGYSIEA